MDTYSVNTVDEPAGVVSNLATTLMDANKGYVTMLEKADEELKPMLQRLYALHEAHAAELLELYAELGGNPDSNGSMMGAVHTAVAHARDLMGTLDSSARDDILSGEERILSEYEDALGSVEGHDAIRNTLATQRQALKSHLDALGD